MTTDAVIIKDHDFPRSPDRKRDTGFVTRGWKSERDRIRVRSQPRKSIGRS